MIPDADPRTTRKLIDRKDIMNDLVNVLTPKYFPKEALDHNRVSMYGMITEAMANSIEDTLVLEQRRAADYCPELSTSEVHVNQTAKIRGVGTIRATPGRSYAYLGILKEDIIEKGIPYNSQEIHFIVDRRSTILYGGVHFALEDDIIIRAIRRNGQFLFTANYTGEHSSYDTYIQMFNQTSKQGDELVALICQVYQCEITVTDLTVVDDVEFMYDGLYFYYDDMLASFEVFYKKSGTDTFKKADVVHYLTDETTEALYYNDDESGVIRIMNNPYLNLGVNTVIRVEIRTTLGTEGAIELDDTYTASFQMYYDAAYNYSGVHVRVVLQSDVMGASDGDTLQDIKHRLIDAKTRRDNITTEYDVIEYINDVDANVQLVKKRNDIQDRNYFMYVLMRYGDRDIAPATTKRLEIEGPKSEEETGDFDQIQPTVDRKIIRAYNKFKLHIEDGSPDYDYMTKCPIDENEPDTFYFTCPYLMVINELNIVHYYYASVDTTFTLSMRIANNLFPYQIITQGLTVYRDDHDPENYDKYWFTVEGTLNTNEDTLLVDKKGNIIDKTQVMCHIIFTKGGTPCAYLPMQMYSYTKKTRKFKFMGAIRTSDYITEEDFLEIPNGLYEVGKETNYNSVVDFKDISFEVDFMYKFDDVSNLYPRDDPIYMMLPDRFSKGYVLMNSYYNNKYNLANLIIEFNKFSRSPVKLTNPLKGDGYGPEERYLHFSIGSVPFFEFNFGIEWTHKLYDTFRKMAITYGSLLKLTTDFEIALKFIATYGPSKYIYVTGGQKEQNEIRAKLRNLNPTLYFKVYGFGAPVDEIRQFIYEYMRDTYIQGNQIFMSNVCTLIEERFPAVRSIKYLGVDNFDGSYQQFTYEKPVFVSRDIVTRYIPEQLNITDIRIELDETTSTNYFERDEV